MSAGANQVSCGRHPVSGDGHHVPGQRCYALPGSGNKMPAGAHHVPANSDGLHNCNGYHLPANADAVPGENDLLPGG